jgi:hypothetical protein
MESKALALGKQVKAEALNSNVHPIPVITLNLQHRNIRHLQKQQAQFL